jgi:hypothetical protein
MAYPTVEAPYGLVPVKLVSGSPYVGVTRQYKIDSGYATNIFKGDLVKIHTDGTIQRETADAAVDTIGVFMGCSYTDPTFGKVFRQYYPTGTVADDIQAYVVDATDVLFKVAIVSSTTVIGDMAQADIGRNAALVDNTGDTATGNSKVAVSETTANTATLPVRIVELVEETKNASGGFTEALVKWNAGHQMSNTTGQGS